ncbi:PAS domain-containing protein [Dongia sp.]|uniref:PAS domain-containing protein n=1 Tax=Dongia sp. TaxID=1977262 RepID=UPI0035AE14B2
MSFDDSVILHPALRTIFRYWRGLSVGGALPRRREIDPGELRQFLPHLYLLDAGATPDDLRYRLAGSRIVQAFGFEPGGRTRAEIRAQQVRPERQAEFDRTSAETHRIVSERVVAYTHDHMTSYTKDYLAYARLNMPISEDGQRASGVLGAIYLSSDAQPFWDKFEEMHIEFPLARILSPSV